MRTRYATVVRSRYAIDDVRHLRARLVGDRRVDGLSRTRSGHIPTVLSTEGAARFVPDTTSLTALARAACDCKGCPLWADAIQTVFGEGPRTAPIMLVGEQPGDQEDRKGAPFVGPAGRVLWQCLADAGIDRD